MEELDPWEQEAQAEERDPWEVSQPSSTFNPAERTGETVAIEELGADWLQASRNLYKHNYGTDFDGSEEDLKEYGLDQMGWFNYNMPRMGVDAARMQYAPVEVQKSFLYMMETYDDLEMSWGGTGRFIKGAALDPTTYVGLASLGLGTIAAQGGKAASKQGIKEILKAGIRGTIIGGVEGSVYGAATSAARQSVEVSGGARESISGTQLLGDAAFGAAAGAVLGGAIDVAGGAVRNRKLPSAAPNVGSVTPNAAPVVPGTQAMPTGMAPQASQSPVQPGSAVPGIQVPPAANAAPSPSNAVPQPKPGETQVQDVIDALKKAAPDDALGNVPRNRVDLLKATEETYDNLVRMGVKSADEALDLFQRMSRSPEQNTLLKVSSQRAAETSGKALRDFLEIANSTGSTAIERQNAIDAVVKLEPIDKLLKEIDTKLSSTSGTDLVSRKDGKLVGSNRNLSPASILKEQKIDPKKASPQQRQAANEEYVRRWDEIEGIIRDNSEVKAIQTKIEDAASTGNLTEMNKLYAERDALVTNKMKKELAAKPFASRVYEKLNEGFLRKNNEFVISSVFSPTTLVMNTIPAVAKVLYKPALDAVVKGFGKAARAEMFHTYSAYKAVQGSALSGARAAFRYERALITGEFNKVLEQAPAIAGLKGRVIRFFPRALAATDEYFGRILYHGYVAGDAASTAMEEAVSKSISKSNPLTVTRDELDEVASAAAGKDIFKPKTYTFTDADSYVKDAVEKSLKNAYEIAPDAVSTFDLLRQRGMDRGYKGRRLEEWMKAEMDRNGDLFKKALNEQGRDHADDMLFKRAFSGKGTVSKAARGYERFVNANPAMRFIQLFVRTPIRVFEEGVRLTPGFQLLAPNYRNDLLGKNGLAKQVRAQGEMMLSYSMATGVMGLFAAGAITGAGPTDYKQRRGKEYAKDFEPYTITFPNGSKFNYRNLDPLATPIKIMVNVLERLEELEYRRSQGEKVEGLMANVGAYFDVAVMSGLRAIQDASLVTGIDQIVSGLEALGSEDSSKMGQFEKFLGQKAQMYVPSTITKTQDFLNSNPEMRDPATIEQFVRGKINPASDLVPRRYNNIGLPVSLSNPAGSLFGPFIPSTKEGRMKGLSEKDQLVLAGMSDLEKANDTNFVMPYKMPGIDLDLRRELTKDGTETYWDRVNRYVYENGVTNALYPLFEQDIGTLGTAATDGTRTESVRSILNMYRKAAFARIMREEDGLSEEFIQRKMKEAEAKAGLFDQPSR